MDQDSIYEFGTFRLEIATHLLWEGETRVNLPPKIYHLLLYFLQHTGQLISREELFNAVWDGRIVDDSALRLAVNSLRNILQDDHKTPRFISTVSRRGYRFLADVTVNRPHDDVIPLHYQPKIEPSPAWIERPSESDMLHRAFHQAANNERCLFFLSGERGAGKTTLIDMFLSRIISPKLAVLRARGVQLHGTAEPFLPLLEALERRCREPSGKALIERLEQIAPTWLFQMSNLLSDDKLAAIIPKVSQNNTRRMLREAAEFFETLSAGSTFILIIDNAQWVDEATLDLITLLAFRRSEAKLLIIVSYRPHENSAATQRIEKLREELLHRGLCHELLLQRLAQIDQVEFPVAE
ncbi:winged helix-turn-helix domain-containing protein [Methylobacter sp. YRD-M1]|uniref:winged helix-turn-helix domain-containing protein n=1 Tax=Methylobacter sp. YRD-M1 TaxID=2911520 RepID=UPI00227A9993|nr:AAA family ATPase [Methylobacter sp. YRD-M1]WAK02544.1 AAA family ATPase [Methylobacter sp. YRD-M1]